MYKNPPTQHNNFKINFEKMMKNGEVVRGPFHISQSKTPETEWREHQRLVPVLWESLVSKVKSQGISDKSLGRIHNFIQMRARIKEYQPISMHQKPAMYVENLNTQPFWDLKKFSWVKLFEDASAVIKAEMQKLLDNQFYKPHVSGLDQNDSWNAFYLYVHGIECEENIKLCPQTTQVIKNIFGFNAAGMAYFSFLKPKSQISPHYGLTNTHLRCHLGLRIPEGCGLRVGNEKRTWQEGKCLVFDESFEHEAWNDSSEIRVVLIVDFWHPELTPEEVMGLETLSLILAGENL